jgi:uncharacterized protein
MTDLTNVDSAPFWSSWAEGRLTVQRCASCGATCFFPRAGCPTCGALTLSWLDCSGQATVYSYTVVHRKVVEGLEPPYILALVDLAEGPRMMTNLIHCTPEEVSIGMPVVAVPDGDAGAMRRVLFRPA